MNDFIFLGPSLGRDRALQTRSSLIHLPPVSAGDILSLMKYTPRRIGIVDGYFGRRASVWHKEILFAIGSGCEVYGSSSMGALRAAELYRHGMVGIGTIFECYRDGHLEGDDEVAIAHAPKELGWTPTSIALVEVRFALSDRGHAAHLSPVSKCAVMQAARALHFTERSWATTLRRAAELVDDREINGSLLEKVQSFSIKGEDAHQLVERMDADGATPKPRSCMHPDILTAPLMAMIGRAVATPVLFEGEWTRQSDAIGKYLRLLPPAYLVTSLTARALFLSGARTGDADRRQGSSIYRWALRIYVDMQVARAFPTFDMKGSLYGKEIDRAIGIAARLIETCVQQNHRATAIAHYHPAQKSMLGAMSVLTTSTHPTLLDLLHRYDIRQNDVGDVVDAMLNIEAHVLSFASIAQPSLDLDTDWWALAVNQLGLMPSAEALSVPHEARRCANALLALNPSSYHAFRFGFKEGIGELYDV